MARPAGISKIVEAILQKEAARLQEKSDKDGLDDLELARLMKLLRLSQLLVNPAKVGTDDLDKIVEEFAGGRDPTLFPKRGPKSTSTVHDPDDDPPEED